MATQAQVAANRLNARKSTGPRTAEGKTKAAQNAVKHGFRAARDVIVGEDPGPPQRLAPWNEAHPRARQGRGVRSLPATDYAFALSAQMRYLSD